MASDALLQQLKPEEVKEITTAFNEFDKDRNGFITAQEMKECLRRTHISHKKSEIDQVMKSMDDNRDGTISYDEYVKFMARMYSGQ